MSLYSDASLAMIPSAYKDGKLYSIKPTDGSGDFTFTRGSNLAATRVDVNGLIEKGRENLLLQSNQFDTTWVTTSSITLTSGQSGYDGSSDAWSLARTSTGGQRVAQTISSSGVQSYSVYAKANVGDWLHLYCTTSGTPVEAWFDLENGVLGASGSASRINAKIESIGNGWYRCSVVFNATATQVRIYPTDGNGSVSGTNESIYIQDAQLEQGLVATDYIETTTTTAQAGILEDMPRLDYSGGASCPALLLEPTRTNSVVHSEYFGGYIPLNLSVDANASASVEGLSNATKLTPNTTNNYHDLRTSANLAISSGTCSIFVKANGYNFFEIGVSSNGTFSKYATAVIDLSNGTNANTGVSSTWTITNIDISNFENDWYRLELTFNVDVSTSTGMIFMSSLPTSSRGVTFQGDGTSGCLIYGLQLEYGSYPTSYIPCYGAATTRSDDFNNQNDLISTPYVFEANDNFTFMYEGSFFDDGASNMICGGGSASLGSTGKSYWWLQNYANRIRLYGDGELLMASANYTFPAVNTNGKYLVRKSDGVIDFFVNGTKLTTTQVNNNLRFDLRSAFWSYNPSVYTISGKAKQFLVFETALTDSEAIALTTI